MIDAEFEEKLPQFDLQIAMWAHLVGLFRLNIENSIIEQTISNCRLFVSNCILLTGNINYLSN